MVLGVHVHMKGIGQRLPLVLAGARVNRVTRVRSGFHGLITLITETVNPVAFRIHPLQPRPPKLLGEADAVVISYPPSQAARGLMDYFLRDGTENKHFA